MGPGSSDSARGSSSNRWDPIGSSFTNLRGCPEERAIDDKETASRAVAFVVQNSRRGIVHLCTEVADLMKAKTRLEVLVQTLENENAHLKEQNSCHVHTDGPIVPAPPLHCSIAPRKIKNRSTWYTGIIRPGSPPQSTSKRLTPGVEDILRGISANSSDSSLSGRTKNRSLRCSKLRTASPPPSTSTSVSPGEGIHRVPLLPSTLHSPASSEPQNCGGNKNRSSRCTRVNKCSTSTTSFSSLISPSEGLSEAIASKRDETASAVQNLQLPGLVGLASSQDESTSECGGVEEGGNVHTVTVEVHHTSQDEPDKVDSEPIKGCQMFRSVGVGSDPHLSESVSVQCSILEPTYHFDERIRTVEAAKADLENDNRRLRGEMDRLNRELNELKVAQRTNDENAGGLPNSAPSRDECLTVTNLTEKSHLRSLPDLVEPDKGRRTSVKSLNKITARCTFHLGDRVLTRGDMEGRVQYIGTLKHLNASAMYAGIQLESSVGSHDGSLEGYRYFRCPKNRGMLIPVQDVQTVLSSKTATKPKRALSSRNKVSPYNVQQKTVISEGGPVWIRSRNKDHAVNRSTTTKK